MSTPHEPSSTAIRSRRRLASLSRVSLNVLSLSVRLQLAGVAVAIALLAGCGGSKHSEATPPQVTTTAAKVRTPYVRALIRDYGKLGTDIRAMRAAALKVHRQTLQGTPALRRTTGRFIEDLQKSHLSLKAQNRMIDHAAGAVSTSCDQCFQQLEAGRPIPQIAHPH